MPKTPLKVTNWKSLVKLALAEDLGPGDRTTGGLQLARRKGAGHLWAKAEGVFYGSAVFEQVFCLLDAKSSFSWKIKDGGNIKKGMLLAEFSGSLAALMAGERTALNFIQRLSGIATKSAAFVREIKGLPVRLLDTRKTTPGMRELEKRAVAAGGMHNHRRGLYDMVMLKENHLASAGSLENAVKSIRKKYGQQEPIEVEVRNLTELQRVLPLKVARIMLDNFELAKLRRAVALAQGQVELEASGNVTLKNVRQLALTGVDFISIGSVTHSAPSLDMSVLIEKS